jgi:hypothetical protein
MGKSTSVAAYLADNTSTEAPYVDPKNAENNVLAGNPQLSTVTIAWNNSDTNERKLERIITQKWLSFIRMVLKHGQSKEEQAILFFSR